MDARHSFAQWSSFSSDEALDAIRDIVLLPTNKAVAWSEIFDNKQGPSEPLNTYFTRTSQIAADCEFRCPSCDHNLGDYLLLGKLITGLYDTSLKKEVYRACDTFTIDSLR